MASSDECLDRLWFYGCAFVAAAAVPKLVVALAKFFSFKNLNLFLTNRKLARSREVVSGEAEHTTRRRLTFDYLELRRAIISQVDNDDVLALDLCGRLTVSFAFSSASESFITMETARKFRALE